MGITCKPMGKYKSTLTKLQNSLNVKEKAREEAKRKKKKEEKENKD